MKNEEAELSILGAIILEPDSMDKISDIRPDNFTTQERSRIFQAMQDLHSDRKSIDPVTIRSQDKSISKKQIDFLIDYVPTSANIRQYARYVLDSAKRRDLITACEIARDKAVSVADIKEAVDAAEAEISAVRNQTHTGISLSISQTLKTAFKDIEERYKNRGKIIGLATGYTLIDEMTCGFQKGDLIIIAGRPSMGKTSIAMNIAENICKDGNSIQFFSLEMTGSQLVQRNLASVGRVNSQRMRTGNFTDADWPKMTDAAGKINKWNMNIEDTPSQTLLDIRASARRQSRSKQGLELIIIDYLQLIDSHEKHQSREQEVAKMSRSLKQLAKELNVPVIVISQLNRGLEARADKRPVNSDLRESGSLEQDADVIIFVHRESYYCPDCKRLNIDCGKNHFNQAEAIISKQRNGPTGTVNLLWFGELCRFENQAKDYQKEAEY